MRWMFVGGLLAVSACQQGDWRAPHIAAAEAQIRAMVDDPAARFSEVQLTGDASTGQTCGKVLSREEEARRFIVYIDGTAGPFVEGAQTRDAQDRFDAAWAADCVKEGYRAP